MPITEQEIQAVKVIILEKAHTHFPRTVEFKHANISVSLDDEDDELLNIELLYTATNPVLDGTLMNSLFEAIDEPIRSSGITANTLIRYTDVDDPTRWQAPRKTSPRATAS